MYLLKKFDKLRDKQIITLLGDDYKVNSISNTGWFLRNTDVPGPNNNKIFDKLGIKNPKDFVENITGYISKEYGMFPFIDSLDNLTRVVNAFIHEINKNILERKFSKDDILYHKIDKYTWYFRYKNIIKNGNYGYIITGNPFILLYSHDFKKSTYRNDLKGFIRKADTEEKRWFEECEEPGTFVINNNFTIGKWYKHADGAIVNYQGKHPGYGFNSNGEWNNIWTSKLEPELWEPASDEEIKQKLLQYAKKHYPIGSQLDMNHGINRRFDCLNGIVKNHIAYSNNTIINSGEGHIYNRGQWAKLKDEPNKNLIVSELEKGKIYTGYNMGGGKAIIFRFDYYRNKGYFEVHSNYIWLNTWGNDEFKRGYFANDDAIYEIKEANQEDVKWLKACENKDIFIGKEQALTNKKDFQFNKWYKNKNFDWIACYIDPSPKSNYGFIGGKWRNDISMINSTNWKILKKKEVEKLLLDEARKRGFVKGAVFQRSFTYSQTEKIINPIKAEYHNYTDNWIIHHNNNYIMKNGKWATLIDDVNEEYDEGTLLTGYINGKKWFWLYSKSEHGKERCLSAYCVPPDHILNKETILTYTNIKDKRQPTKDECIELCYDLGVRVENSKFIKKRRYITRVWDSGIRTMGISCYYRGKYHFMSLENYNQEGGVIKYNFYGDDLPNVGYKHYPSSRQEIDYFKKHQNLQSFIFNVGDTVLTPDGIGVIYGISNNFAIFVKVDSNILGHSGISSIFKFGGPLKSKSKKGWFYDMSELEHAESANYTIKRENQEDVIWKEFSVEDDVIEIKKHPMIPEKSYSSDIMYYVDKKLKKKKKKKKKLDFNFEKRKSIF